MNEQAAAIVRELGLAPHPEGGYYREVFRSPHAVTSEDGKTRRALTMIYFLLADGDVSAWHRLSSDETWHFARGHDLEVAILEEGGSVATPRLGPHGPYALVIPAGLPFAARIVDGTGFALVTCCVAPGFEFDDFELLDARALMIAHPGSADTISAFAR